MYRRTQYELEKEKQRIRTEFFSPQQLEIIDENIEQLRVQLASEKLLHDGELAPDFILPSVTGGVFRLNNAVQKGPVILTFIRGGWCPYCNLELRGLQRALSQFQNTQAQVVGVSPELPTGAQANYEKQNLEFTLLCDQGNKISSLYNLTFRLPEELIRVYESIGIDLSLSNGPNAEDTLPIPATFIVGTDRRIWKHFIDPDYTFRLDPDDILEFLKKN